MKSTHFILIAITCLLLILSSCTGKSSVNILIMNEIDANMMVSVEALERSQGLRELLKFSLIVVASVPVLAIYPFVQKYFVKGIMIGAIKG